LTATEDTARTAAAQGGSNQDRGLEAMSTDMIHYLQCASVIHQCNVILAARKTLNICNDVFRLTARQLKTIYIEAAKLLHEDKKRGKTDEEIAEAQAKLTSVKNAVDVLKQYYCDTKFDVRVLDNTVTNTVANDDEEPDEESVNHKKTVRTKIFTAALIEWCDANNLD
jgi:hypothetical protein